MVHVSVVSENWKNRFVEQMVKHIQTAVSYSTLLAAYTGILGTILFISNKNL